MRTHLYRGRRTMLGLNSLRGAVTLVLAAVVSACGNPIASDGHEEPDVAGFAITQGQNTVVLGPGGQSGSMTFVAGQPSTISVRVLQAGGNDEPEVMEHSDEFEVHIETAASGVPRFTTAGPGYPFVGTLDPGTVTGQAVFRVELVSTEHGHVEHTALLIVNVVAAPQP